MRVNLEYPNAENMQTKAIKDIVSKCKHCIEKKRTQRKEQLLPSELPDKPLQKIGVDLCEYNKESYKVMEDYYGTLDILKSYICHRQLHKLLLAN